MICFFSHIGYKCTGLFLGSRILNVYSRLRFWLAPAFLNADFFFYSNRIRLRRVANNLDADFPFLT